MEKVLIALITAFAFIGFVISCIFFWKWWLKYGLQQYLESDAKILIEKNDKLNKKLKAKKRECKQLQEMLEDREELIIELEEEDEAGK